MRAVSSGAQPRAGRGWGAAGLAAIVAALMVFSAASGAVAADVVFPDGPKTLIVHPGIEPSASDQPGTGLPPGADSAGGVAGHSYELRLVPGFDLEHVADWNRAAALTVAEGERLATQSPAIAASDIRSDESIEFSGLATGLYLVTETAAPAGAIRALPFFVALPLPDPTREGEWLTTVHVYPKTAAVNVRLGVRDASAVTCGDPVAWTSLSAIPDVRELASYRVQQVLADGVTLRGSVADVEVSLASRATARGASTGQEALLPGEDYAIELSVADGRDAFDVNFTDAGIAKLLRDPSAELRVSYTGAVSQPGEYTNEVRLYAGDAGVVSDRATTKFGPLQILVHEKGKPEHLIAGADFRLYTSERDARSGTSPIEFGGTSGLTTNTDGRITIECLRFSGFVDGLEREPGSELYRDYFATPVAYPAGWTGEDVLLRGTVQSVTDPEVLRTVVWKAATGTPTWPLSETGGRILAVALLGGVLVAGGVLVVVRSRRDRDAS